jgi:hypothetical protein
MLDATGHHMNAIGGYEVVRHLRSGGMAEVLLARGSGSHVVAIKRILPQLADQPELLEMFRSEAELCARFDHPNLVRGFGGDGGYYAMEYVPGKDLRAVLVTIADMGPVPVPHIVRIGHEIAGALAHVHELGIIHRDVSPSNILIPYTSAPRLIDFGIAKQHVNTQTRSGTIKGKFAYMSPEQARGKALDHRSDVFSLGIVLWELIAGRRLFQADNDFATIDRIVTREALPPSRYRADCPRELDAIVLAALAKSPDRRYQSAAELQRDLDALALAGSQADLHALVAERFAVERSAELRELQPPAETRIVAPVPATVCAATVAAAAHLLERPVEVLYLAQGASSSPSERGCLDLASSSRGDGGPRVRALGTAAGPRLDAGAPAVPERTGSRDGRRALGCAARRGLVGAGLVALACACGLAFAPVATSADHVGTAQRLGASRGAAERPARTNAASGNEVVREDDLADPAPEAPHAAGSTAAVTGSAVLREDALVDLAPEAPHAAEPVNARAVAAARAPSSRPTRSNEQLGDAIRPRATAIRKDPGVRAPGGRSRVRASERIPPRHPEPAVEPSTATPTPALETFDPDALLPPP